MSSHIFGPVPSRRLGRSLGVDLVPFKTCSYNCVYCQLGRTACKTVERKEWVSIDDILCELRDRLPLQTDYITLSGSGEPTLNSRIGELIDSIKALTNVPLAVLTNGSLLWQEEVRRQLLDADLVIPSLDAGDEDTFQRVNRPHHEVSFQKLLHGLVAFRNEFPGEYWLEVFLLANVTADNAEVSRLAGHVARIRPNRVQLNTATRPPLESFAVAVAQQRLHELAVRFQPSAEVISEFRPTQEIPEGSATRDQILDLLRRRPSTLKDIADGLGMHPAEVAKYAEELTAERRLLRTWSAGRSYYHVI